MTLYGTELKALVKVNTMLEKQGFQIISLDTVEELCEYEVLAKYGDKEAYRITVWPIREKYEVTSQAI